MSECIFSQGDVVKWQGVIGKVLEIKDDGRIVCEFFADGLRGVYAFDSQGKLEKWHATPSLVLVSKAIKKEPEVKYVEKTMYAPFCKDERSSWVSDFLYKTKEESSKHEQARGYLEMKVFVKDETTK